MSAAEILKELSKYYRKTIPEISQLAGYGRPQAFYDVINGKTQRISSAMANKLVGVFPNLNRNWLLTGEGSMLKDSVVDYQNVAKSNPVSVNEPSFQYGARSGVVTITPDQIKKEAHGTPVYDIDAVCGFDTRSFQDERIIGYVDLPGIRRDSHIVTASGDSMEPRILNGDKIVVREVIDRDYLFWGQIYLVLTPDYRLLKYVRKHPSKKDYIILRSENPEYEDIELPKDKIVKLFVVENILSVKNMM